MGVVSPGEFRRLLAGLDAAELVDLVADLWEGRGYGCTVSDGVVRATDPETGRCERIAVARRRIVRWTAPCETADVVVASRNTATTRGLARERSAAFVGPETLRELMLYAVDVEERRRLFEAHFGHTPDSLGHDDRRHRLLSAAGGPDPLVGLVAIVTLVVLVSAVVGVGIQGGARPADAGAGAGSPGERTVASTPSPALPGAAPFPPGVNGSGVTDPGRLGVAHARAVRGTSYHLLLVRRISSAGNGSDSVQAGYRRIRVNDTMRFRTESGGNISITEGGFGSISVGVYADGSEVYRRVQQGNRSVFLTGPMMRADRFSNRVERYVSLYLATGETTVSRTIDGGNVSYVVTARGSPTRIEGPVANYTAVAVVRPDGFVRSLNVSYDRISNGTEEHEHVRFRLVYRRVGGVEVAQPSWYPAARNATIDTAA